MRQIFDFLPIGKQNAIASKKLARLCGLGSVRELQHIIHELRKSGEVICSTCQNGGGYYLPASAAEVREFKNTLANRAENTLVALRSAEQFLLDTDS